MHCAGVPVPAILDSPQRYDRKRIFFGSVYNKPLSDYLAVFTQITKVKARLETEPYESMAAKSKDLADMFVYFKEYGYYDSTAEDMIDVSKVTSAPLTTFDQWVLKSGLPAHFK